jgi:hypothetical protein
MSKMQLVKGKGLLAQIQGCNNNRDSNGRFKKKVAFNGTTITEKDIKDLMETISRNNSKRDNGPCYLMSQEMFNKFDKAMKDGVKNGK